MTDPAQPVEATPLVDAVEWENSLQCSTLVVTAEFARSLERCLAVAHRQLSLAQTENSGHIRIEDELKAELREAEENRDEWKEQTLTILLPALKRAQTKWQETESRLAQAQARCAELEKLSTDANIAYGSLWNDRNSLQEKQDILVEFIQKIYDQAHARWKKEARSILAILDL